MQASVAPIQMLNPGYEGCYQCKHLSLVGLQERRVLICGTRKTESFCSVYCSHNCHFSYSCISLALKSGHLPEVTCALDCIPLKPSNYLEILWTAAAEFPGRFKIGIGVFFASRFQRRH